MPNLSRNTQESNSWSFLKNSVQQPNGKRLWNTKPIRRNIEKGRKKKDILDMVDESWHKKRLIPKIA